MMKSNVFDTVTISAKVIRANGKVEDLGVIAQSKPSVMDRLKGVIKKWLQ